MNQLWLAAGLMLATASTLAAAETRVTINMGQPGYYGRVDIGNFPPPQLIYAEPVIVQRAPVNVAPRPIYLHVPPGHAKDWSKHCRKYNACGQPVYFVDDRWYSDTYVPAYSERHGKKSGPKKKKGHYDD